MMQLMNKVMAALPLSMSLILPAFPSAAERVPLWPEDGIPDFQPHQIAAMTDEAKRSGFVASDHRMPYLDWFEAPKQPNGGCMLLFSGGGYYNCCDIGLIRKWRQELTELGFQCVNVVYRTPRPKGLPVHQSAWEDGQRAIRLVRAAAKERGFDPERIGLIGMSAGGHLVTMLATSALTPAYARIDATDDIPCHANWAIAHAPAYNTATSASGEARPQDGTTFAPSVNPCFQFDAKTCPMCFLHGGNDQYTPNGSTLCYRELRRRHVPAELHLYAGKGHGAHGFDRAVEFMRQLGFLGKLGPEQKLLRRFKSNDDRLSVERQNLWPEGVFGPMTPSPQDGQCQPYLEWHLPKELKSRAVQIIYSGGCYTGNSPESFEVAPMRRYLNARGVTVVTLKYRTPRPKGQPKHLSAWQDLQRAVRLVRSQAAARGLDSERIGIMGSSAGGHLTLMGALSSSVPAYEPIDDIDRLSCSVQWAVAIYPAYVLTDGIDGPNSHGGNADEDALVPELAFDAGSCPMLFIHGDADEYSAMGSVKVWEKLRTMGIQCDLHTLAGRKHCFQHHASPGTGSYTWMDRVWEGLAPVSFGIK